MFRFCSRMERAAEYWEVAYDDVPVVGLKYRLEAVLDALEAYDEAGSIDVYLIPDPDNQHDPNAIKVEAAGRHIGYLPAVVAESVAFRRIKRLKAELVDADIDDAMRVKIVVRVLAA